jgi:hypothetical protein
MNLATWSTHGGQASQYEMIVEIWDVYPGGTLLLATMEHGTTTMANTRWRANGQVTFVAEGSAFDGWDGRSVHERGRFVTDAAGAPLSGTSIFRLN